MSSKRKGKAPVATAAAPSAPTPPAPIPNPPPYTPTTGSFADLVPGTMRPAAVLAVLQGTDLRTWPWWFRGATMSEAATAARVDSILHELDAAARSHAEEAAKSASGRQQNTPTAILKRWGTQWPVVVMSEGGSVHSTVLTTLVQLIGAAADRMDADDAAVLAGKPPPYRVGDRTHEAHGYAPVPPVFRLASIDSTPLPGWERLKIITEGTLARVYDLCGKPPLTPDMVAEVRVAQTLAAKLVSRLIRGVDPAADCGTYNYHKQMMTIIATWEGVPAEAALGLKAWLTVEADLAFLLAQRDAYNRAVVAYARTHKGVHRATRGWARSKLATPTQINTVPFAAGNLLVDDARLMNAEEVAQELVDLAVVPWSVEAVKNRLENDLDPSIPDLVAWRRLGGAYFADGETHYYSNSVTHLTFFVGLWLEVNSQASPPETGKKPLFRGRVVRGEGKRRRLTPEAAAV